MVLVAFAALFAGVLRHPQYTPDGIVYARFAARDAGESEREATLTARAFYEKTSMMNTPRYRDLIELDPSISFARSKVFENRVLYPWAVSLLLPPVGFRSLFLVSALSYVAFGLALYWTLLAFGRPVFATALTIIALVLPLVRSLAASDLTDMFAMVWWTLALGALLRWMREPRELYVAILAVTAALLTLTRPTPYLVILPAIAAAITRRSWLPLVASSTGVLAFAATAAATHAYGVGEQLRWVYSHRPNNDATTPFNVWYRSALVDTLRSAAGNSVRSVVPVVALGALLYGIARTRLRDEFIVLLLAAVACCIALPFNPVPSAIARVVVLPLVPVFCAIAQCFIAAVTSPEPDRRPASRFVPAR